MSPKTIAIAIAFCACHASAQSLTADTLTIHQNTPTASAGYAGGINISRDTTNVTGGVPGIVSTPNFTRSTAGANVRGFEWATISIMDNHATEGENVATYSQGNKFSSGPTWGAVSEVCDLTQIPAGTVGHEVDMWVTGPDTGLRIGVDVVLGDSMTKRGQSASSTVEGSVGLRIGNNGTTGARWTRGVQLTGKQIVGIDTSSATLQTAIRLGEEQQITFDKYDQTAVKYKAGRFSITYHGRPVFEVDMSTGDIYKKGKKVL